MLLDFLIFGALIVGAARLLNATVFKSEPASRPMAAALAFLSFLLLFIFNILVFAQTGDAVVDPTSRGQVVPFCIAWLFYSRLRPKSKKTQSVGGTERYTAPGESLGPMETPSEALGLSRRT
jgi:hypothetical protein